MSDSEKYNGWTNRETWAVALHINNDQGWQESVHEALRDADYAPPMFPDITDAAQHKARQAGEIIRENVEEAIGMLDYWEAPSDIGSLWRVNWTEIGESFLSDLEEG